MDLYFPDLNLAIEYCGLFWHSEEHGKDRQYYNIKLQKCLNKNIRLITIFQDEWLYKKEIVKNRLSHILNISQYPKLFARKCHVCQIDNKLSRNFFNTYHIQGSGILHKSMGLFYQDELMAVMSFNSLNRAKGSKNVVNHWELSRFASKSPVTGAASKLFANFIKLYDPDYIMSYSDRRWNTGMVYKQIGMDFVGDTTPGYWVYKGRYQISSI